MPVTTREYKSALINTGDALPYPIAVVSQRVGALGTMTIDLTAANFAGVTLMEVKQCNLVVAPEDIHNIVAFTMDGSPPALPGGILSITTGAGSRQIVLDNLPCMRTIDGDTDEIRLMTLQACYLSITFW